MRFPSKKSFVRASLVLIFALPTLAHADEAAVNKNSHYLNLEEAQKAFGSEFSLEDRDGTFTLFGGTSASCLDSFDIKNDPKKGEYKILYKGDKDVCLKFEDALKGQPRGAFRSLADLPDSKMKPEGTFDKVDLAFENAFSSKHPWDSKELQNDKQESLSHVSSEDAAKKKKLAEEEKKKIQTDTDVLLVTKCHRGLDELDVGDEALARLAKLPEIVKDKGEKWFADNSLKFQEEKFQECRIQLLKTRTGDATSAECEDRLKKIAARDEKYIPKVKAIYLELLNQFMNSSTLGLNDAFTASISTIEKIRGGFDLSEKEEKDLATMERKVHLHFLQLAANQGSDSEAFKAMKDKMLEYMAANDETNACVIFGQDSFGHDTVLPVPAQRMNPACGSMQDLALQLNQQTNIAAGKQVLLNKDLQAQADIQGCATLRANSASTGTALNPADEAKCKAIETAANTQAKSTLNAGINADGFGQIVKGQAPSDTAAPPANSVAGAASGSGNLNSGNTASIAPPANITVNTTSPERRLFR